MDAGSGADAGHAGDMTLLFAALQTAVKQIAFAVSQVLNTSGSCGAEVQTKLQTMGNPSRLVTSWRADAPRDLTDSEDLPDL